MNYRKLNVLLGWLVFLIATIVYFMTVEDTVSLWDCGEYIMAAYKLEVGHPPGAPLFMLLGRLFTFFANPTDVALWINRMSALSSSFTILFMFWSITLLVKKMVLTRKSEISTADMIAIFGSGIVGSLAYTFSETFWFSAVEGEVYAMSSLFTAIVFWAILKWDEEMELVQGGKLSIDVAPNRWLILILFLIGLAIGVHLLGILLVPAIGYVIYFRAKEKIDLQSFLLTGIISLVALAVIQEGVIPGTISIAGKIEVFFRNTLGFPFNAGTIFFFILLIALLVILAKYTRKNKMSVFYNSIMGLIFLLIGYGTFSVIVIRSNADTPMDQNNPENLVNLHSYLKREQYGSAPLLSGPYWNSKEIGGQFNANGEWQITSTEGWKDRAPVYARRFVVTKNDNVVTAFLTEQAAVEYANKIGGEYKEKFYETNTGFREKVEPVYDQTTIFPRMYNSDEPRKVEGYKMWSGYDASRREGEKGKDQLPIPSFGENMQYFMSYQMNWMYFRYFMWNFAGRQNDFQGDDGNQIVGNWKSGFNFIDDVRLGNQDEAPYYTTENKANNSFFLVPLILGLIGMFFHAYRNPKDAFVVFLGFLLTGIAIVVYLNQKVYEPRERDYAYAGSFYFFAMWIGIGVFALYHAFTSFTKEHIKKLAYIVAAGLAIFVIMDMGSENGMPNTLTWLTISVIGGGALFGMNVLGKAMKNQAIGATLATILGLTAPILMGAQGWDDHDRSNKSTAHDVAYNYLSGIGNNGIIFTNGDNDTFPLWYLQEVEGFKSDVRVANLSLMQTDWYTAQMMRKTYGSDPLPIKFTPDQILMYTGGTDQVYFFNLEDMYFMNDIKPQTISKVIEMRLKDNMDSAQVAVERFAIQMREVVNGLNVTVPAAQARVNQLGNIVTKPFNREDAVNDINTRYAAMRELFSAIQNKTIEPTQNTVTGIQNALRSLSSGWQSMNIEDAMAFVRDDENMIRNKQRNTRFFPTNSFTIKVNKENVMKSGVVAKNVKVDQLVSQATIKFGASYLTREELIMLDVIANNNWKRPIHFSNAHASKVSKALLDAGLLKQVGSTYAVSPLDEQAPIDEELMYASLMTGQRFGKMNDPKVLTDYYARRHTTMFRMQFSSLARYYLSQIDQVQKVREYPDEFFEMAVRNAGADEARLRNYKKNGEAIMKKSKQRLIDILKRAEEIMPVDHIFDNGEPNMVATFKFEGADYPKYGEGFVHEFIEALYIAGDKETAEKLLEKLEKQNRQTIEYFLNAPMHVVLSEVNQPYFFSAVDTYIKMYVTSNKPSGNPSGAMAQKTGDYVQSLFDKRMPDMYNRMKMSLEDVSEARKGRYSYELMALQDYFEALLSSYGMTKAKEVQPDASAIQDVDFETLMEQQNRQDSTNPNK